MSVTAPKWGGAPIGNFAYGATPGVSAVCQQRRRKAYFDSTFAIGSLPPSRDATASAQPASPG